MIGQASGSMKRLQNLEAKLTCRRLRLPFLRILATGDEDSRWSQSNRRESRQASTSDLTLRVTASAMKVWHVVAVTVAFLQNPSVHRFDIRFDKHDKIGLIIPFLYRRLHGITGHKAFDN
jgi:hypothetical protein